MKYELQGEDYVLLDDNEEEILRSHRAVGIAYSIHSGDLPILGTLHKHGNPDIVRNWYNKSVDTYRTAGLDDEASELRLASGAFPVDELNKCISITGYIYKFHNSIQDGTMKDVKF